MLKDYGMIELAKIMHVNGFARLNIRENMLRDSSIKILATALIKNKTIVHLDICQSMITPKGFRALFKALLKNESITSIVIGNPNSVNRNRIGREGTQALANLLASNR